MKWLFFKSAFPRMFFHAFCSRKIKWLKKMKNYRFSWLNRAQSIEEFIFPGTNISMKNILKVTIQTVVEFQVFQTKSNYHKTHDWKDFLIFRKTTWVRAIENWAFSVFKISIWTQNINQKTLLVCTYKGMQLFNEINFRTVITQYVVMAIHKASRSNVLWIHSSLLCTYK